MKILIVTLLITLTLFARTISTNEVYAQAVLLQTDVHYILDSYGVTHNDEEIKKRVFVDAKLKPRDVYQKTYEIMIKLNILRNINGMVSIEPVNIAPILHLNPDLVYEQIRRLLEEFRLFEIRNDKKQKIFKLKTFTGKTPLDVFNVLSAVSVGLDILNGAGFTPSFVYGENIRVHNDLTLILNTLELEDNTIPAKIDKNATPADTFRVAMRTLQKIKQLQTYSGIDYVDFRGFEKDNPTPSEVFTMTQMILAELQTIKAFLHIDRATAPAYKSGEKTPVEVNQLMSWNLRKLNLINSLIKGEK